MSFIPECLRIISALNVFQSPSLPFWSTSYPRLHLQEAQIALEMTECNYSGMVIQRSFVCKTYCQSNFFLNMFILKFFCIARTFPRRNFWTSQKCKHKLYSEYITSLNKCHLLDTWKHSGGIDAIRRKRFYQELSRPRGRYRLEELLHQPGFGPMTWNPNVTLLCILHHTLQLRELDLP